MRTITLESLAGIFHGVNPGARVVSAGNAVAPLQLINVLDAALSEYRLFVLNPQPGLPDREGVRLETVFVGPGFRRSPRLDYLPCRLSMVPRLFEASTPPDVVLLHTTPPRDGQVSLGVEVNILPAAIRSCRQRGGLVIAQVNPNMPWTYGDSEVSVEDIDIAVEIEEPLPTHAPTAGDDVGAAVGEVVAARVPNGATVQAGIGAVPDAVLASLTGHRNLRVWTEMFSDGVLTLDKAGALESDHPLVTSFLFGSAELYDWVADNRRIRMVRSEKTNAPGLIAQQRMMTSINTALQVDLYGQVNASWVRGKIHSGFGGQSDFVSGAIQSVGGQALIALRSWHPKAQCSTIVPLLEEPVTSFQPSAVVTEHGIADLWGVPQHEQSRRLITRAAHPDVRDELWEEAQALHLL